MRHQFLPQDGFRHNDTADLMVVKPAQWLVRILNPPGIRSIRVRRVPLDISYGSIWVVVLPFPLDNGFGTEGIEFKPLRPHLSAGSLVVRGRLGIW